MTGENERWIVIDGSTAYIYKGEIPNKTNKKEYIYDPTKIAWTLDSSVNINENGTFSVLGKTYLKLSDDAVATFSLDIRDWKGTKIYEKNSTTLYGINFLSYNYLSDSSNEVRTNIYNAQYFKDVSVANKNGNKPEAENVFTTFIVTNYQSAQNLVVGDFVDNIAFNNENGDAQKYNTIPGITRVTSKLFIPVTGTYTDSKPSEKVAKCTDGYFTYNGTLYEGYNGQVIYDTNFGTAGFYLYKTVEGAKIYKETKDSQEDSYLTKQLPISDDLISRSLRWIPMKGLNLTSRHKPGYDENGNVDLEGGVKKIYSMLADDGIKRGLCNPEMVDYRYIIDSMGYGLDSELGGKVHLAELAKERGKTTAILNLPSKKQFTNSINPYFCDSYISGVNVKPAFSTKYIPQGGNAELYATKAFSLPTEEHGSKFTACFWPWLTYTVNGKKISVPPAADVSNVLIRKFNGGDPYVIAANMNGILSNNFLTGIEYDADTEDRDYLEPFGVNTIIRRRGNIMIYGNQTAFQDVKSDFNKLHVRENLNTIEIECERILHNYNFQYNTAVLRAAVVTALTPVLQNMQESGALDSYTIVCDETNNTPEIIEENYGIVDINCTFNHGMEKIVQRIYVNRFSSTTTNE